MLLVHLDGDNHMLDIRPKITFYSSAHTKYFKQTGHSFLFKIFQVAFSTASLTQNILSKGDTAF